MERYEHICHEGSRQYKIKYFLYIGKIVPWKQCLEYNVSKKIHCKMKGFSIVNSNVSKTELKGLQCKINIPFNFNYLISYKKILIFFKRLGEQYIDYLSHIYQINFCSEMPTFWRLLKIQN